MNPKLILILLFSFIVAPVTVLRAQTIDEQAITHACFDKLFKDMDAFTKNYKRTEFESDRDESLRSHRVEYKEKLYEYELIKDTMMRRLISSNRKIYESDKEFRSFDRDLNLDRSFFDRFEYRFKQHNTKLGTSILVFQFFPKSNLSEKHILDRVINRLEGEVEIRESDMAFLTFRANLPGGSEIEFAQPPFAGATVLSATILVETAGWEGLTLLSNVRVEFNYSTSLVFTFHFHHIKVIELKAIEKIKEKNNDVLPTVSSDISKDHELSDHIWRTRRLMWYLTILTSLVSAIIILFWWIKKRSKR